MERVAIVFYTRGYKTDRKEEQNMKKKKWLQGALGVTASVSLILILFLTAFEVATYGNFGFYEKEYRKYEIQETLPMEMDDIMDVTKKMMAYLKGDREELSVYTNINGEKQDFFNDQDRFHMGEVRDLFLGGFALRKYAVVVLIVSVVFLIFLKADLKRLLPKVYEITVGAFVILAAMFAVAISVNFDKCFVIFHEIFFDNDLWMFDPVEDYMIRMLPEGFFFDMTIRIGTMFLASLVITLVVAFGVQFWNRKKEKIRLTYK